MTQIVMRNGRYVGVRTFVDGLQLSPSQGRLVPLSAEQALAWAILHEERGWPKEANELFERICRGEVIYRNL